MESLFINFLKRAFLVPLIVAALIAAALITFAPKAVARSNKAVAQDSISLKNADITAFTAKEYNKFKELQNGELVGTIKCESILLGEKAVLFNKADGKGIEMSDTSTEPWKKGSVMLFGANTSDQFKNLHNASIGDVFTFSFYDNDSYDYKITAIYSGVGQEKLKSYSAPDTLVMCLPYNDFTDFGNSFFYRVYVAKLV